MKFIIFTQIKLDGDECKQTKLGKVAVNIESIRVIQNLIDKYDCIVPNVVGIILTGSDGAMVVSGTIDSITEELSQLQLT